MYSHRHRIKEIILNSLHLLTGRGGRLLEPAIQDQLNEFENAGKEEMASYWEALFDAEEIAARLRASGVTVEDQSIDCADFEDWRAESHELESYYHRLHDVKVEKLLEHYLTQRYLCLRPSDSYIDVAACGSPLAGVLRKKGIAAWSQDLLYPDGISAHRIGGNAANMPLADCFADILALHCAFECFMGDDDQGFVVEAGRILKKGGRMGIVPLYFDTIHFVKTSPYCNKAAMTVEKEARWLWRDDMYRAPFSRHYSPEVFASRIAARMEGMDVKILHFVNLSELRTNYPGQRIYCHFMLKAIKL